MTTLDSLWMGVPVLTLAGDRRAARMGDSIMNALGLREFVAYSPEDFVAKAATLAGRLDELSELRASLRGRLEKSALADGVSLARALEEAFRAMCAQVAQK
jgi:predicted O-linked N-acetylglucosamine transferase (SPINDLY family)